MSSIRTLQRQLPVRQLLRHLPAEGARRLFNRYGTTSYSQNGEDLLICSLLGWPRSGYFVDVGCHHPIRLSNTYALYLRGLSGLAIDANDEFRVPFRTYRPRDAFVRACVGHAGGTVDFTVYVDRALSSAGTANIAGISREQYQVERVETLPVRRLDHLLEEADAPKTFDLLSIDVEGQDFSALQSLNLQAFRPRLIVIELHDVVVDEIGMHDVSRYLRGFRYLPVAAQKSNVFYALK